MRFLSRLKNIFSIKKNSIKPTWTIANFKVTRKKGCSRFHDFNFPNVLMHGIYDSGFKYCTPIQTSMFNYVLNGRDGIGKSQTGTGKTAAFLITTITLLLKIPAPSTRYLGEPRAVIIAPTRELALQIMEDAKKLIRYTNFRMVLLIGGMDILNQQRQLNKNVDIIIGTPGRILDFIERQEIYLDLVETLVLDEADRMLDMGFIEQIKRIIQAMPSKEERQTLLFSATFSNEILKLTKKWTYNPVYIDIDTDDQVTDNIKQEIYLVSSAEKYQILTNLIKLNKLTKIIIFVNFRHDARQIAGQLQKENIKSDYISGEISQKKRASTLNNFKNGKIHVLIATDVAGRGIHIEGISHVINYNLPENSEDYIHRIGRTGRAGFKGSSISFACEDDAFLLENLEKKLGKKLNIIHPPKKLLTK